VGDERSDMYRRKRNRVKMVLAVRVVGKDASGAVFDELTHTLDIASHGVRLGGMERVPVKAGDIVEIRRLHRKARFRVAWVGQPGSSRTGHVGLKSIDASESFWGIEVPEQGEQPIPAGSRMMMNHEHA
jgi:hypothetical protein